MLPHKAHDEIEITEEMIDAGTDAADLLSYEWGYPHEEILVSRVYRAMEAARRVSRPKRDGRKEQRKRRRA